MMNISKKKHTTLWWVLGLGLVFIPAWLLCFYLASLAIYDLFVDTLVVALAPWLAFLATRPRVHRQETVP